jgi:hypothetical protein
VGGELHVDGRREVDGVGRRPVVVAIAAGHRTTIGGGVVAAVECACASWLPVVATFSGGKWVVVCGANGGVASGDVVLLVLWKLPVLVRGQL